MSLDEKYRALLRWYPRRWRTANEEVVLGTLLDAAEAAGRTRPGRVEVWSLRVNGLGERLSTSSAMVVAALAVAASFAGSILLLAGAGMTMVTAALTAVTGIALTASALGVLRESRVLSPTRAIAVLAIAAGAWILCAMAGLAWSVGFDEADAGLPPTPLSAAFVPLVLAGWVLGATAVATLVVGVTRGVPRALRYLAAAPAALILPPVLGVAMTYQSVGMLAGCVLLLFAARRLRSNETSTRTPREPAAALSPAVRAWAAVLLSLALTASLGGALFALLGAGTTLATDGTHAMRLGLAAGQLANIPLALCAAIVLSHRRPRASVTIGASAVLMMIGSAWYATGNLVGSSADGSIPWTPLALIATGIAVAVFGALRMQRPWRALIALAVAVCSLLPLWLVMQVSAFLVPVASVVLLIVNRARTRRPTDPVLVRRPA